ncbi:MAG: DUF2141 domain-containing protein [Fibrobacterota bacterium]
MKYIIPVFITIVLLNFFSFSQEKNSQKFFRVCGTMTGYLPRQTIYLGVYASQQQFKTRQVFRRLRFLPDLVTADSLPFCFDSLPPGEYIIAGYQDTNRDRHINMGWRGPREPYCFHKEQRGILPPGFNRNKFMINSSIDTLHLRFTLPAKNIGAKN